MDMCRQPPAVFALIVVHKISLLELNEGALFVCSFLNSRAMQNETAAIFFFSFPSLF
jgi:hypothetical protein